MLAIGITIGFLAGFFIGSLLCACFAVDKRLDPPSPDLYAGWDPDDRQY